MHDSERKKKRKKGKKKKRFIDDVLEIIWADLSYFKARKRKGDSIDSERIGCME